MSSKFLDTLFDNIIIWLGPRKRKRDEISIGEYENNYTRIPDPQKKVFKSGDSQKSLGQLKQVSQNGNLNYQQNGEISEISHSVKPSKSNMSPCKDTYYQVSKKEIKEKTTENSNSKSKIQDQSFQKVISLVDCNNVSKKNEYQKLNRNDSLQKEIIVIEDDETQIPLKDSQLKRQSSSQIHMQNYILERENYNFDLIQLPDIFQEFKSITDEWVIRNLDFIEGNSEQHVQIKDNLKAINQLVFYKQLMRQQKQKKIMMGIKLIIQSKQINKIKGQNYSIQQIFNQKNFFVIYRQINKLLDQFHAIYELKIKKQKQFFLRFKEYQLESVQDIFDRSFNTNQDAVTHQHILERLSYKNLQTLSPTNWLNDEVINAYIRLITQSTQSIILNTFFYLELQKNNQWNKIKRICNKNKVTYKSGSFFVPININKNHWVFVEVNNDTNQILYYDSLAALDSDYSQYTKYFLNLMENLQKDDGILSENIKQYKLITGRTGIQENNYDCGIFMIKGIHYRSLGITGLYLWIDQTDASYYRYLICYQLLQGKIDKNQSYIKQS